jgi:hypothetical protein
MNSREEVKTKKIGFISKYSTLLRMYTEYNPTLSPRYTESTGISTNDGLQGKSAEEGTYRAYIYITLP